MTKITLASRGLAEDEQDVIGQPVARVLEQEPDHPLDGGVQVGQGQGRGHVGIEVKEAARAIAGLGQPVGIEQQPVTRLQRDVLPGRARLQAERRHELLGGHELQSPGGREKWAGPLTHNPSGTSRHDD